MRFTVEVTGRQPGGVKEAAPEGGMYIHGLTLEGGWGDVGELGEVGLLGQGEVGTLGVVLLLMGCTADQLAPFLCTC